METLGNDRQSSSMKALTNCEDDVVGVRGGGGGGGGGPGPPELASSACDPQARFSKLSEKLRQVTPDDLQCSVFCGGKKCKYESGTQWEPKDMAIDGLFSHWVTDEILACARPNANSIEKYGIIDQFKRSNIKSIINLQSRGEHSKCGPALHDSGFSYDPQVFMQSNSKHVFISHGRAFNATEKIFFYNYSIKDYGVASRDFVLDMVKVVAFALTEGKVAIHCHAGLGRTGVLIACYLVYALRVQANDAIRYIRIKRPNSIQTRNQILCIQGFSGYISPSFVIFAKKEDGVSLLEHLRRQKRILHGYETRNLKYTPKLIYVVCERLLHLCGCNEEPTSLSSKGSRRLSDFQARHGPFWKSYLAANTADSDSCNSSMDMSKSMDEFSALSKMVATTIRKASPSPPPTNSKRLVPPCKKHLSRGSSSPALMQALYVNSLEDTEQRKTPSSMHHMMGKTDSLVSFSSENSPYGSWDQESALSEVGSLLDVPLDDDAGTPTAVNTTNSAVKQPARAAVDVTQNACFRELASQAELRNELAAMDAPNPAIVPAEELALLFIGLGTPQVFDDYQRKKCQQYQEELNSKALAWYRLSNEMDPKILLALLISWFHTLQKPVLNEEERAKLTPCDKGEGIVDVIGRFSTVCRFVLEYLVRFVHRLRPLSELTRNKLVDRFAELLLRNDDWGSWTAQENDSGRLVVGIMKKMLQEIGTTDVLVEPPVSR